MFTLSNSFLEVLVSPLGAELQSIRSLENNTEYLWQGDSKFWGRRAPVLFPIVGKVWNGQIRVGEQTYAIEKHGFARDMHFDLLVDEPEHKSFRVCSDDTTREHYPWDFQLVIDYTLVCRTLFVTWEVHNTSSSEMSFHIGAHPAFNYSAFDIDDDLHGYLSFNTTEPLSSTRITSRGYAADYAFDIPLDAKGLLPLTNSTFGCDTILDTAGRISSITLHAPSGQPLLTLRHTMPVTALWSPFGGRAPFICIEPWCGCCDTENYNASFALRPFTNHVAEGATWRMQYSIEIH